MLNKKGEQKREQTTKDRMKALALNTTLAFQIQGERRRDSRADQEREKTDKSNNMNPPT